MNLSNGNTESGESQETRNRTDDFSVVKRCVTKGELKYSGEIGSGFFEQNLCSLDRSGCVCSRANIVIHCCSSDTFTEV